MSTKTSSKTSGSLSLRSGRTRPRSLLRAEQWAMVGVVSIGALAAYLLTRARPRDLERIEAPRQPFPLTTTGETSASLSRSALGPYTDPFVAFLRRGDNVLGRLELGGNDRAGDDATALRNLQLAGFTDVRLFTVADINSDPRLAAFFSLAGSTPATRWFYGTWNGNGTVAAGDIIMPREVVLLWHTATTPPPRMAFASPSIDQPLAF